MSSIEKAMQRKSGGDKAKSSTIEAALEKKKQESPVIDESAAQQVAPNDNKDKVQTSQSNADQPNPSAEDKARGLGDGVSLDDIEKLESSKVAEQRGSSVATGATLEINLESLEQRGFVALSNKRTLINEEYRSIKRKLLNNAFGPISKTLRNSNLILVSSSKPNEGKTFTAVNLALSIALEQDKTVLLVDSDVLKPSVAKTLEIGDNVGLIEYLSGEQPDITQVMYRTNVNNLRLIPAGLPHHLSNELLSSDKMMKLIEEFATRYPDRIVVFDAPPLLGVNETSVMAEQCGQGVVVVEEHKSKLADVKKAVDLLPKDMAVGFVLNKVTSHDENQGYGYYYGSPDK